MIAQPLASLTTGPAAVLAARPVSQEVTDWTARIGWVVGLLLFVALLYWLMRQGWKWRGTLQGDLPEPPALPESGDVPDDAGDDGGQEVTPAGAQLHAAGRYHGSTSAGQWLDRIVAHGLGVRSRAELTLTPAGVHVVRPGARDFLIPVGQLRGARLEKGIAGKVLTEGGLLVIVWRLGDRLLDSGFRLDSAAEHQEWAERIEALAPGASEDPEGPEGSQHAEGSGDFGGSGTSAAYSASTAPTAPTTAHGDSGVAPTRPHHPAVTPERDT
ncbi:hypothetical protein K378_04384 [Streptomyces sp. Amel2xB2]|nr:hypothetical protein K378_04384 [Streptomyces sp. Amel2xB2]